MRKTLFTLLLLAVSIIANAQMSHNFFGLTLGVSTRQQVINTLNDKKITLESTHENGLLAKNVTFDGTTFAKMMVSFYDGKLANIWFSNENGLSSSLMSQLADKYTKKYPSYRYYFTNASSGYYMFDDDVMQILVTPDYLYFSDMKLQEQSSADTRRFYRESHPYTQPRISTTILGCTLGVSTKQQVINAMKSRGLRVVVNKEQNSAIFMGTSQEGVSFEYISASFFQGKLETLLFMNYERNLAQYEIDKIASNLSSKYSAYDFRNQMGEETDGSINFFDDKIMVAVSPVGLGYSDYKLNKLKQRSEFRSLRGKKR